MQVLMTLLKEPLSKPSLPSFLFKTAWAKGMMLHEIDTSDGSTASFKDYSKLQPPIPIWGNWVSPTHTPPKFNSSPLKNGGWKTTVLGR